MWWKTTLISIALSTSAFGQDAEEDSPWAEPDPAEGSTESTEPVPEAEPEAEAEPEDAGQDARESDEEPQDLTNEAEGRSDNADTEEVAADTGNQRPRKAKEPVVLGENFRPNGVRIAGYGTGTGVGLALKAVVGSTGGTTAGIFTARYTADKWGVSVGLPVAHHRTPGLRFDNSPNYTTGLGNLALDAHYVLQDGKTTSILAVETHFNVGNRAYTWVNDGDELWPGYGIDVAWEGSSGDKLKKLYRLSLGLHGARGHSPYPAFFPRIAGAFGLDYSFSKRFGFTTEAALSYWDTSPFDRALIGRVDLLDGLRTRDGFVLPVSTWAGLIPADQEAGLTESTLFVDMRYAF